MGSRPFFVLLLFSDLAHEALQVAPSFLPVDAGAEDDGGLEERAGRHRVRVVQQLRERGHRDHSLRASDAAHRQGNAGEGVGPADGAFDGTLGGKRKEIRQCKRRVEK